jgi:hypothetical protein
LPMLPTGEHAQPADIRLGNAKNTNIPNASADFVLSSPPYCTRIDYAVATSIELAILRMKEGSAELLRRSLMGTSTVSQDATEIDERWGRTCVAFLDKMKSHPSKASQTYYLKNHIQYFRDLHASTVELKRILKPGGACALVVQDSYYKEVHNDVPTIVAEMAASVDLRLTRSVDFPTQRSMVGRNKRARKYLGDRTVIESVLCFQVPEETNE